MNDVKLSALKNEIIEYLNYDDALSSQDKSDLLSLSLSNIKNKWAKTIYHYFNSHIDENGNAISLEVFLKNNNAVNANFYKRVNNAFIKNLFKNNSPLYFFDVDNTLTDNGVLSPQKQEFIKNWKHKDRIILSTGKLKNAIMDVIDACEINNNYSSFLNGSAIFDGASIKDICKLGDISNKLIEELEKTNLEFVLYNSSQIISKKKLNAKNESYLRRYNEWYEILPNGVDCNSIIKILVFIYEDEPEKELQVQKIIKGINGINALRTGPHSYEILKREQHKGNTVKLISKMLNRYYRCTIGVGDSMNDFQMLNYVGLPFIVSTSNKELKDYGFKELIKNREIDIVNLIKKYE